MTNLTTFGPGGAFEQGACDWLLPLGGGYEVEGAVEGEAAEVSLQVEAALGRRAGVAARHALVNI